MHKNKGQQAVEFAILVGLVFITALLTIMILGESLSNFFTKNAVTQTAQTKEIILKSPYTKPENEQSTQPNIPTNKEFVIETNGVKLTFPPDVAKAIEEFSSDLPTGTIVDATGSTGNDLIVNEINKLIAAWRKTNPTGDPPVEIMYGSGIRGCVDIADGYPMACSKGKAQINMVTIKLNNNVVVLQSDQDFDKSGGMDGSPMSVEDTGIYKIEGTLNNNKLSGKVSQINNKGMITSGNYTGTMNTQSNTAELSGTIDNLIFKNHPGMQVPAMSVGKNMPWNFSFNNPS